jgi:hypothetical protein
LTATSAYALGLVISRFALDHFAEALGIIRNETERIP